MYVLNRHERLLNAPPAAVGALIDTLASREDKLWPTHAWPQMRFDRPLSVGAVGGHGPIRYHVESYDPGQSVRFRFTAPKGFEGTHAYCIEAVGAGQSRLVHTLEMHTGGLALISWPVIFRPMHDALIEDSLDCAERTLHGEVANPKRWSPYVRMLRAVMRLIVRRR